MTQAAVAVQKAAIRDIPAILSLINSYAARGIMLPRTEFEMSENIRDFSAAYDGETLLGCGALHFYTPTTAEVRSLAVLPEAGRQGVGSALVEALEEEARENDLESIFAFTYVPGFFAKLGFHEVERGELPLKVWKDCLRCPKFQNCDEIAVAKYLRPHRRADEKWYGVNQIGELVVIGEAEKNHFPRDHTIAESGKLVQLQNSEGFGNVKTALPGGTPGVVRSICASACNPV